VHKEHGGQLAMSLTTITTKYAHAGAGDDPEAARSCVDVFGRNKVDVTRMLTMCCRWGFDNLGMCCSKIAEAEAAVSVNEKKWLVMGMC
jgi:heterodisulfide reductase subunit B